MPSFSALQKEHETLQKVLETLMADKQQTTRK